MGEIAKQGLTKNQHAYLHVWLRRKHGSACKCENESCPGVSKCYHWSLIHGKKYEKNRDNFRMLCASCHQKYDFIEEERKHLRVWTDERRRNIGNAIRGKKRTPEQIKAMSERSKGSKNPFYGKGVKGEQNAWFGRHHTPETKRNLLYKHARFSKEQINEILKSHAGGVEQKKIAQLYNVSRATICRIVNKKRYIQW